MASLGSFGAAVREANPQAEKDTFEFFGQTFVVTGVIPPMLMLQLGAAATGKIDEQEGLGAIWEAMRCSLTEPAHTIEVEGEQRVNEADASQFQQFYRVAVDQMADLQDLIKLAMTLFEAQSARPTRRQPAYSDGLSTTSQSSNGSTSQHPALQHLRPVADLVAG